MTDLTKFLQSDDEYVKQAAEIVQEAKKGLALGELTSEQYDEIIEDILQVNQIHELANDLDRKIKVQKMFDLIKLAARVIPK